MTPLRDDLPYLALMLAVAFGLVLLLVFGAPVR